jgi:uncharacterized repeat protein (TIGR03803 family)
MKIFIRLFLLALACIGLGALSSSGQTFTDLHIFAATDPFTETNSEGANCFAGLVLSGNALYGTAYYGGVYGDGTVFKVNTDGTGFTNLHTFTGGTDGAGPYGQMILAGNTLYGTTDHGNTNGGGSIFKINTDGGGFGVVYNFGANITTEAGVIYSSNILYGATYSGGLSNKGTVFAFNLNTSTYATLYNFSGLDGANPYNAVMLSGNTLYGTTFYGGTNGGGSPFGGYGAVYRVNTDGTCFTNLHSFDYSDGKEPMCNLVLSGDTLYGTTLEAGPNGAGCIFAVNTDGSGFTNLYSFTGYADGGYPQDGLALSGNTLYGAIVGGTNNGGVIFSVKTDGTGFAINYNFSAEGFDSGIITNSEGADPYSKVIISGNTLYGTTEDGTPFGNGSVFRFDLSTPASPVALNIAPAEGHFLRYLISWPSSATNYVLQQNLDLSTTNWMTSSLSVFDNGTTRSVQVNPTNSAALFRLFNTNSP